MCWHRREYLEEAKLTTALATRPDDLTATLMESVVVGGDLKNLSTADRLAYYKSVCESLGLNPLTKPFDYITLNGRLTLYARRDATDQLRRIHGISVTKLERETHADAGLYVVTAYATDAQGRSDSSIGAVSIKGLAGENLANAFMKAETKAKRRVTLSLAGLGWLDETEAPVEHTPVSVETGEIFPERAWSNPTLKALLQAKGLRVKDLSPICGGDMTRANYADFIDRWLGDEEGRTIEALVALADGYRKQDTDEQAEELPFAD